MLANWNSTDGATALDYCNELMIMFGRRARVGQHPEELQLIVEHTLAREYPACNQQGLSLQQRIVAMLGEAAARFQHLTAEWIRVGCVHRISVCCG